MLCHEGIHAIHVVGRDTYACSATQVSLRVFVGVGIVAQFGDIFVRNQTDKFAVLVNNRQFLHFVCLEGIHDGLVVRRTDGDEVVAGHDLADMAVHVGLEAQVAVGNYTYEHMVLIHHGDAAYMVVVHHLQGVADGLVGKDSDGVGYHAVLGAFDMTNLGSLGLDGHVLVNHSYTTFASDGNGHLGLGNRVHSCADDRDIQGNMT